MKTLIIALFTAGTVLLPCLHSQAAGKGEKGPSAQAYEHASDKASFKGNTGTPEDDTGADDKNSVNKSDKKKHRRDDDYGHGKSNDEAEDEGSRPDKQEPPGDKKGGKDRD